MKQLTIKNLILRINTDDDNIKPLSITNETIDHINEILYQRDIDARLLFGGRPVREQDISIEDID